MPLFLLCHCSYAVTGFYVSTAAHINNHVSQKEATLSFFLLNTNIIQFDPHNVVVGEIIWM